MNMDRLIEERIREAGWWKEPEAAWRALPLAERERIAFGATGCLIAYPTWPAPVDCAHPGCQVKRGELPRIALMNLVLRHEARTGWWRDFRTTSAGRQRLARMFRAYRRKARETGIYDPWKISWEGIVFPAVLPTTEC
jgi:hypothetical protein